MPRSRAAAFVLSSALCAAPAVLAGCGGGGPDIRTVADFDAHPCALVPNEIMTGIVAPAYREAARGDPTLVTATPSHAGDMSACTYAYEAKAAAVPQMRSFTVTIAHTQAGNQPLAICVAGATSRAAGYTRRDDIGDAACLSPSADLWLRVGEHYFHVVVVPQPGFTDPVDRLQATAPLVIAVGRSTADRLPWT